MLPDRRSFLSALLFSAAAMPFGLRVAIARASGEFPADPSG